MSYDAFEISAEGGAPVELFTITVGNESPPYRMTSAEDFVTVAGDLYEAIEGLKRGKTEAGGQRRAGEFTVELPSSHAFIVRYAGAIPGKRVTLTVRRYHRQDTPTPELRMVFDGRIESIKLEENGHNATLTARSPLAALSHTIPREGYQTRCNNVLFDDRCTVDRTNPAFRLLNASVTSVDGRFIEVASALSYDDGWFTAGRATIDNDSDHRMIVTHSGSTIELLTPFPVPPTEITLYAGDNHTLTTCVLKFNNGINFRGHHFVPKRNIFIDGVLHHSDIV